MTAVLARLAAPRTADVGCSLPTRLVEHDHFVALVALGVALLNDAVPGWRTCVDVAALDVTDPDRCVLAQVFGSYRSGCDNLHRFAAPRYRAARRAFSGFTPTTYWLDALEAS